MEPQELSSTLLQPQVTVMAILGELVALLPREDGILVLDNFGNCLYWDLEDFTRDLQVTLHRTEGTWWYRHVSSDDDDSLTSPSQALAAWESTPRTTRHDVTIATNKWQESVSLLVKSWAQLAKTAIKLRNACRDLATEVANMVASTDTRARELQDGAAFYGTAQENMVELGQALGREEGAEVMAGPEGWRRGHAMEAASQATRATMERRRVEIGLCLLERLVAACDEAIVLPQDLRHLMKDIKAALEVRNEASHNVRKNLVAKVAQAERLCEANARLVKGHLEGTLEAIKILFSGGPTSPRAREVVERCQRATEDIPRLLRLPECLQSTLKMSPVSMKPQEVSPPQLQVLVTVVGALGEVVATVTGPHWGKFPDSLYEELKNLTRSLRAILDHGGVTSLGHRGVPSLGRALATLWATPGTTWANVRAAASTWRELMAKLVDSWDWLAREATKLHEKLVVAQQLKVALDKKEVTWEMVTHGAQVAAATNEAMGAAVVTTRRRHWAVAVLEPLQRLVATCDRATLFNWNMEWQLRDIEAILTGINEASPDVLQALMAKVAKFEQLWEASTHLAKDHLLGTLKVIDNILLSPYVVLGGPGRRTVAEWCQKAIEDIPRLLQESFT